MSNAEIMHLFVRKNNCKENIVYVLVSDNIGTLRLSNTYNENGERVGTAATRDRIKLITEDAVAITRMICTLKGVGDDYKLNDEINGRDNVDIFDDVEYTLRKHFKDGKGYELYFDTCVGFNYCINGVRRTLTIQVDRGRPTYKVVRNKEVIRLCEKLLNSKPCNNSTDVLKTTRHTVIVNHFDTEPYTHKIEDL